MMKQDKSSIKIKIGFAVNLLLQFLLFYYGLFYTSFLRFQTIFCQLVCQSWKGCFEKERMRRALKELLKNTSERTLQKN